MTQCADLLPWLAAREDLPAMPATVTVWVTLCYDECATDLIPVPSGPCRTLDNSVQPSRVKDAFRLELSLEEPPLRGDLDEFPEADVMTKLLEEGREARRQACGPVGLRDLARRPGRVRQPVPGPARTRLRDPRSCRGAAGQGHGATVAFESDSDQSWVTFSDRPLVLSTQFLQEWLLRVEGGGHGRHRSRRP